MVERIYQLHAFVVGIVTVWLGIRFNLRGTINLGAAYLALCLYLKLVDWWWDWIPTYVFFLLVGAIAIVLLAAFWKVRERTA